MIAPFLSLAIVSAMSEWLDAEVVRDGHRWTQKFSAGVPLARASEERVDTPDCFRIRYRPDPAVFRDASVSFLSLAARVQEFAIFHPATRFRVEEEEGLRRDFHYPRGLLSYLDEVDYDSFFGALCWHMEYSDGPARAEAVVHYRGFGRYAVFSYVNGRRTRDHGSHVEGFEQGFTQVVTPHVDGPLNLFRSHDPILSGMTVLLAVEVPDPSWRNSTKDCLDGEYPRELARRMVREKLPGLLAMPSPDKA
jgi:DNA gyrase subunit B